MTSKASLHTLPEELILTILTHITSLSTLANLASINPLFHRLTTPKLYHTFPGRNSELFLRTISHHPSLARHTRTATWRQERRTAPLLDTLEKQHITTRLNELSVPHGLDLAAQFAKFGKSEEYWFFEVLLLFLPEMQSIVVEDSWLWDDHHYWFKSQSPFFNPLCASALTNATLHGPMRIENVIPLLTIPSLEKLHLSQVTVMRREGYRVFQWSVWPVSRVLPERSSNMKVLVLRDSYIDAELLMDVLRGVKALAEFSYEHVPNDLADEAVQIGHIDTEAWRACVALHKESLETLRVRDTGLVRWECLAGFLPLEMDLKCLKTLDIGPLEVDSFSTPMSVDMANLVHKLPLSLDTLSVKIDPDSSAGLEEALAVLAHALFSAQRALTVQVVDWDPLLGWFPESLPMLQTMYRELGLRLVSVPGDVVDVYRVEQVLIDEESEEEWVIVTSLNLSF